VLVDLRFLKSVDTLSRCEDVVCDKLTLWRKMDCEKEGDGLGWKPRSELNP